MQKAFMILDNMLDTKTVFFYDKNVEADVFIKVSRCFEICYSICYL